MGLIANVTRMPANGSDGSFDTQWACGCGAREAWRQVTLDEAAEASAIRVKPDQLAAGVACVVQVSDDGDAWRPVSAPFSSAGWSAQAVSLAGAATSRRWRLLYTVPSSEANAGLFEVETGPLEGR